MRIQNALPNFITCFREPSMSIKLKNYGNHYVVNSSRLFIRFSRLSSTSLKLSFLFSSALFLSSSGRNWVSTDTVEVVPVFNTGGVFGVAYTTSLFIASSFSGSFMTGDLFSGLTTTEDSFSCPLATDSLLPDSSVFKYPSSCSFSEDSCLSVFPLIWVPEIVMADDAFSIVVSILICPSTTDPLGTWSWSLGCFSLLDFSDASPAVDAFASVVTPLTNTVLSLLPGSSLSSWIVADFFLSVVGETSSFSTRKWKECLQFKKLVVTGPESYFTSWLYQVKKKFTPAGDGGSGR